MGRRSSDSDSSHVRNRKSKTRRRSRSKSNSDSSSSSESSSRRRRSRNDQKSSRKSPQRSRATRRRSRSRDKTDRTTSAMSTKTVKQEKTIPQTQVRMSFPKLQELSIKTPGEQLKDKVQRAINAAALIDSELKKASLASNKSWGRSTTDTKPVPSTSNTVASDSTLPVLTVQEQTARVDALQAINAPGFQQQSFTSRSEDRAVSLKSQDGQAALVDLASIALPQPVKANVAHDKLFLDPKVKQEQWIMKLFQMRQKKLNGEAMN